MKVKEMTKEEALAKHWGCEPDDITESSYDDCLLEIGSNEFLVLTDDEADQKTADYIRESICFFNSDFIAYHTVLDSEAIQAICKDKYEDINPALIALIGDGMQDFIDDAIGADGRGHFLSSYDGNEIEIGEYFIYQVN